jgi:hypothetical protein
VIGFGNAEQEGRSRRGWFMGHFVGAERGLLQTQAVEVKWGVHTLGEARPGWARSSLATTLSMLVQGCIRYEFDDGQQHRLVEPGDYAVWSAGVGHRWWVEEDRTIVVTVRWPSLAGDAVEIEPA